MREMGHKGEDYDGSRMRRCAGADGIAARPHVWESEEPDVDDRFG